MKDEGGRIRGKSEMDGNGRTSRETRDLRRTDTDVHGKAGSTIAGGKQIEARENSGLKPTSQENNKREGIANILIVPIRGVITQRSSWLSELFGGTDTESIGRMVEAGVLDPTIDAIVLDIDSPGGEVSGTPELSKKIFGLRGKKPIVAVANADMASAAYWIGSAADEIAVIPSGMVGSIGVVWVHLEMSKALENAGIGVKIKRKPRFKYEGNTLEPLSKEADEYEDGIISSYYEMFAEGVARNRGVSVGVVNKDFGQGRMLMAQEAKAAGLVDRVATLDEVAGNLAQKVMKRKAARAEMERFKMEEEELDIEMRAMVEG
jgi:signal peptide peptidase SppA